MTRYKIMFERCRERGEGALGAFLMLGDRDVASSQDYLDALVEGGADMVEVGIPFSDPIADGPVIQAAATRALAAGVRTDDCLAMIAEFRCRHRDVPVGVLTYANIVVARGKGRFARDLAEAGCDSLLLADVPALEARAFARPCTESGVDYVMISATNTLPAALSQIAGLSSGYSYCVARPGVTGADEDLALGHGQLFAALADLGAPPPVLGFGIATPGHVQEAIRAGAAGAISGSAIVRLVGEGRTPAEVSAFVKGLKAATALVTAVI